MYFTKPDRHKNYYRLRILYQISENLCFGIKVQLWFWTAIHNRGCSVCISKSKLLPPIWTFMVIMIMPGLIKSVPVGRNFEPRRGNSFPGIYEVINFLHLFNIGTISGLAISNPSTIYGKCSRSSDSNRDLQCSARQVYVSRMIWLFDTVRI